MEQAYVSVRGLAKHFGNNKVFADLNFDIAKGEFLTLLGPSGCGKSTLLRCIAGLETPDDGKVIVNGKDVTWVTAQKRGIGMVFQSYALFPNMSVIENIGFGLKMQKVPKSEIDARCQEVIDLVELREHINKYPAQLSGGQKQRVALARALVTRPSILLLDEPLSALDARIRRNLREQIRSIQKKMGLTTIFVTHDQEEAMTMSDRIFLMSHGDIVQAGNPEDIYLNPANEFAARFIGSYNVISAARARELLGFDCDKALVAIRPESVIVHEDGQLYPVGVTRPLLGSVISHQLLGNVVRYRVELGGERFTVDVMNRSSLRLYQPGDAIKIVFNLNEIVPIDPVAPVEVKAESEESEETRNEQA